MIHPLLIFLLFCRPKPCLELFDLEKCPWCSMNANSMGRKFYEFLSRRRKNKKEKWDDFWRARNDFAWNIKYY
jgi:hypothetical protein